MIKIKIISVIVTPILFLGGYSEAEQNSKEPLVIKSLIIKEAKSLNFPPEIALAVAHAESNFLPNAVSPKGARGIMQIMPSTALGEYGVPSHLLFVPTVNIRIGIHFLSRLLVKYDNRIEYALSYYNGGSAVGSSKDPQIIPATETYVAKVMKLKDVYFNHLTTHGGN